MILDSISRLMAYRTLCPGLSSLERSHEIPSYSEYAVDREHFALFIVRDGEYLASTTWRENPFSREATAAVRLTAGEFVMFLPGEPYLLRELEPSSAGFYLV